MIPARRRNKQSGAEDIQRPILRLDVRGEYGFTRIMTIFGPFLRSSSARRHALWVLVSIAVVLGIAGLLFSSAIADFVAAAAFVAALPLAGIELRHLYATFRAHDLAMREAHDGLWSWYPISK